jgi:hypothetical protein
MPEHETKVCERCGSLFQCKSGNITACQCTQIKLSEKGMQRVAAYSDCLCIECLKELNTN